MEILRLADTKIDKRKRACPATLDTYRYYADGVPVTTANGKYERVKGLEIDASYAATSNLRIDFNAALIDEIFYMPWTLE